MWNQLRLVILPAGAGNCQAIAQDWILEIKVTMYPIRMKQSPNYLAANAAMGTEWTVLWLQRPIEMRPAGKAAEVVCSLQQRL